MHNHLPEITATEFLTRGVQLAAGFLENANGYLERFKNTPTVKPKVSRFYRTYDGSTVLIIDKIPANTCPVCGRTHEDREAVEALHTTINEMVEEAGDNFKAQLAATHGAPDDDDDFEATDDQPHDYIADFDRYVVQVIRGGHGHPAQSGDKPGSIYRVNDNGLSLIPDDRTDDPEYEPGNVVTARLHVVGMSLAKLLQANFTDVEAASTKAVL